MSSSLSPNPTLYINNLNDKINKDELKSQLYSLFMTYGRVIDIVAQKGAKMKGQAFLAFADLAEATTAMRALDGMLFYDKPLHIQYAKSKSYAVLRREDPDFVPPNPLNASSRLNNVTQEKRSRDGDEEALDSARHRKRERQDEDGEEMELEDDDDSESRNAAQASVPTVQQQPSARLLCTNLPMEVTDHVLSVLFQQYQGFLSAQVAQSQTPNAAGQKVKMAQVIYDSPDLASVAKEALDGFTLKKDWNMSVTYI
ncbi:RNA-binding domain-containing [Pyrrhoderma noxium]|uniref:RNA-binding domain-containing n=1 Tax=Pyrrhoderma noxium TaxID=2282107 RepID=A0A286UMV7_9AGAM|nr:RNA-binding domain-containing [Pyrrhoderma noxium]